MFIHRLQLATNLTRADAWADNHNCQRPLTIREYNVLYNKELPSALNFVKQLVEDCSTLYEVASKSWRMSGCHTRYLDAYGEVIDIEIKADNKMFDYILITLSDRDGIKISDAFDVAVTGLDYEYELLPIDKNLNVVEIIK